MADFEMSVRTARDVDLDINALRCCRELTSGAIGQLAGFDLRLCLQWVVQFLRDRLRSLHCEFQVVLMVLGKQQQQALGQESTFCVQGRSTDPEGRRVAHSWIDNSFNDDER